MNDPNLKSVEPQLSFNTRKSLCVHINHTAGEELADFLEALADRIRRLETSKVDVTPIAPANSRTIELG